MSRALGGRFGLGRVRAGHDSMGVGVKARAELDRAAAEGPWGRAPGELRMWNGGACRDLVLLDLVVTSGDWM